MRIGSLALTVPLIWLQSWCASAWADGGTVRLVERQGDYQISVFTAPNPLRSGPVDISVLVQNLATGQPAPEAHTILTLTRLQPSARDSSGAPILAVATSAAATNKLFQSALLDLPEPGEWNVTVTSTVKSTAAAKPLHASFTVVAAAPLPRWLSEWTWFCWPAVAVLVFAVHRVLLSRSGPAVRLRSQQP